MYARIVPSPPKVSENCANTGEREILSNRFVSREASLKQFMIFMYKYVMGTTATANHGVATKIAPNAKTILKLKMKAPIHKSMRKFRVWMSQQN